jgi:hypothetical protein
VTHQNAAELARAAEARAYKGEIILLVTDRSTIDLAVNLVLNLRRLHLEHYLLVAESAETCSIIHVRTDSPRRRRPDGPKANPSARAGCPVRANV